MSHLTELDALLQNVCKIISSLPLTEKIEALNHARQTLHTISPFVNQPVDFVKWIPSASISPNDYNPNSVATPEMELLYLSIKEDGITMPIVTITDHPDSTNQQYQIVDGFHRYRTITERPAIFKQTYLYAPVSIINKGIADRMASTIRHNRARGKHGIEPMATIVANLIKQGWDNEKIAKHLGMEAEEVLRLKQVTGIATILANSRYDTAWEVKS